MEFRKIFDTIPAQFDRWRPRYCDAAFSDIIQHASLVPSKSALEIGPGTGQATEPILKTGCDYLAIELGEHLSAFMEQKFRCYENFHLVNADFETYDFSEKQFDLIYSAATIQWIPEEIAFRKTFDLLKPGGSLAMMLTKVEYKSANEALYNEIQHIYDQYFHPEIRYSRRFHYENAINYGFVDFQLHKFPAPRILTADEYIEYLGTHSDHIVLKDEYREPFFGGIHDAITRFGGSITMNYEVVLFLTRKPQSGKKA